MKRYEMMVSLFRLSDIVRHAAATWFNGRSWLSVATVIATLTVCSPSHAQLSTGQVVRVSSSFNVRASPVYTALCYGQAINGAVGIVRGGPTTGLISSGNNGTWYDIEWGPDSFYTHPTSPSCRICPWKYAFSSCVVVSLGEFTKSASTAAQI